MERFENREWAGKALAAEVEKLKLKNPVVLGVPRGGIPVAYEVAQKLQCPLDVMMTKKIGAPHNPELAVGAVGEDGTTILNQQLIESLGIEKNFIKKSATLKSKDIQEQIKRFRGSRYPEDLTGKDVIVVDDGLATGSTMKVALRIIRKKNPNSVTVAIPVAPKESIKDLQIEADEVICLLRPENFFSVGLWYEDFDQVSTDEVAHLLQESRLKKTAEEREILIDDEGVSLKGDLVIPSNHKGLIIFSHGSGSSRKSPRNQFVAAELNKIGFGTLLFDLLSDEEEKQRANVFNIPLLARRLNLATKTVTALPELKNSRVGYFGASTGAGAALLAAAESTSDIFAIVSRGGRPDLAGDALVHVKAPCLLIVGGNDPSTLTVNQDAAKKLKSVKLTVIPKATHLFEEEGALSEVVEYASDWYLNHLLTPARSNSEEKIVKELKKLSVPFDGEKSLDSLIAHISKSRIVMLGESSHGTHEFYALRRIISQRLITDYNFDFVAVEGDWPDFQKLNLYIKEDGAKKSKEVLKEFYRWPTWMWANEDTAIFLDFLRESKTPIYGLDVYSLFESLEAVKDYVQARDLNLSLTVESAYSCLDPFQRDEKSYARHLLQFPEGCRHEVVSILRKLLRIRTNEVHTSPEHLFSAQQNARIVADAEDYYRKMLFGGPESWNVRDRHMVDTLDQLLKNAGPESKCIVWAHNSHIGDYHATEMQEQGYVNLGGLARERFGIEEVSLVGFGTYKGKVLASHAWEGEEVEMTLPKAKEASFESFCHKAAQDLKTSGFSIIFDPMAQEGHLGKRSYGHRAVGVVYDSEHEVRHNYVSTVPAHRYDAFIFIDETTALRPIKTKRKTLDIPETWPGGV